MEFFNEMDALLRTFWYIALPVSFVFIIQTILTFIGGDATDGLEADFEGDMGGDGGPFQLFSLRNLINFLLGFSWFGISFWNQVENKTVLIGLAVAVGLVFLFLFFFIIKQLQKLQEDNTFTLKEVLGKTSIVYLRIPEKRSGSGKIQVSVRGSVHELLAVTDGEEIPSGAVVRVSEIIDEQLLLVEKV
jgi:hypothetical protein